jgi:phosphatidylglycerol:prolipoprotein diacylglycerol transferase
LNGCCFGTPTDVPWAVYHPPDTGAYVAHLHAGWIGPDAVHTLAVHPVALYHTAAGLLLLSIALGARATPGRPLAVAVIGYAAARFALEFFRGDATPVAGALDLNQLFCLTLLTAGVAVWLMRPGPGVAAVAGAPSV